MPKPEDGKQIRPFDDAAQKLLQDPDDTHMYVNELIVRPMKTNKLTKISGSPHQVPHLVPRYGIITTLPFS